MTERPPVRPDALRTADHVVFDTTFPRHLATLGAHHLVLLQALFGSRAVIPRAVELELRRAVRLGHAPSAQALIAPHGILRTARLDSGQTERAHRLREDLPIKSGGFSENLGEAEAIILAQDLAADGASVLVIDDGDATVAALGRGINTLGSVWVLMLAALESIHDVDDAWDLYVRLIKNTQMGIPATGWQPDRDGRARFGRLLEIWRAAAGRSVLG